MKVSIKWALIGGFVGLQAIPVSIILASTYVTSQRVLLRHAKDIMENIAAFTIHEAQGYLRPAQDAARLTQRLADSDVVSNQNKRVLEQYFYKQMGLHSNFAGIYLGSPTGEFLYVSRMDTKVKGGYRTKIISLEANDRKTDIIWKDPGQNEIEHELDPDDAYDPRKRPWYIRASETRKTIWTEPYIFFTSRKPGLTAASPVFDSLGELTGVVGVDIEIDELSTFLSRLKVGKRGLAFILNRNGDIVAFPDPSKIKRPAEAGDGALRLTKISELDDTLCRRAFESLKRPEDSFDIDRPVFGSFTHEGKNYHTMFAPFSGPQWPWLIGIYIPEDDYLGPIKRNRLLNIYVMVGIAALASIVGFMIARSIVKPMIAFRTEARAVHDDDLDTTYDKHSVIKEIQETADSFSQMKDGLKSTRSKNLELAEGLRQHAEQLRLKEMHLRATFTSLVNFSDALIVLDTNRHIRFINPAAESLLGVEADRTMGEPFQFSVDREATIEIDSGTETPVIAEMLVVDTEWEGNDALLVSLRDITERKRMEEEIRWRADTLAALHETALDLAAKEALPELLQAIAVRATNLLAAKGTGIFLFRPGEDALEPVLWHNLRSGTTGSLIHRGQGVSGRVLANGQPLIVNDYETWEGALPQHTAASFNACVGVPILWRNRPLGVLLVGDDSPRTFCREDTELLKGFTPLAAAALEQRRLLEEAEKLYARAQQDAETKSILLKEVNHRVKNNLSAIIGVLYAERRHAAEKANPQYQAAIQDLINRMQGLATVHSLLTASEWKPLLISELAENVIRSVLRTLPPDKRVAVQVAQPPIRVTPAQANSLAMVLNEMSTNSVKHALQDRNKGQISVDISLDDRENRVKLEFRDDGPGYPQDVLEQNHYNTGLYLIRTIVEKDLLGTVHLSNDPGAVTAIGFVAADGNRGRIDA